MKPFTDADDTEGVLDVRSVALDPLYKKCDDCKHGRKAVATRVTVRTYDGWSPRVFGYPRNAYFNFQFLFESSRSESQRRRNEYQERGNCPGVEARYCHGFFLEYPEQGPLRVRVERGEGTDAPRNKRVIAYLPAYHPNPETVYFDIPDDIVPLGPGRYVWDLFTEVTCRLGERRQRSQCLDIVPDDSQSLFTPWYFERIRRRVVEKHYRSRFRAIRGNPALLVDEACAHRRYNCLTFDTYDNPAASVDNFATFSVTDHYPGPTTAPPPTMTVWQDPDGDGAWESLAVLCGPTSWDRPVRIQPGVDVRVVVGGDLSGDGSVPPESCGDDYTMSPEGGYDGLVTAIFGRTPRDARPIER